jgi:phage tail tape-measure protein
MEGIGAVQALMDDTATTAEKVEAVAGAGGSIAGGWAGAAAGAAIGSVVPIVGTAIGGIIGGILGSLGGGWLGEKAAQYFNNPAPENQEELAASIRQLAEKSDSEGSEALIRVEVNGGTATVERHTGPAQVDVYSGLGYSYTGIM